MNKNYFSWQQAAIAAEESIVNGKINHLQQKCVEAEEAATQNQPSKVFSIIGDILAKWTTNSVTKVNKRNGNPPANRDWLAERWGKYFEELLNNSSDLVDTSNIAEAPQDLNINISTSQKKNS